MDFVISIILGQSDFPLSLVDMVDRFRVKFLSVAGAVPPLCPKVKT